MDEELNQIDEAELPEVEEVVEGVEAEEPDVADILAEEMDKGEPQGILPPEHWSAEDKAFLASLPNDAARERALGWRKSLEGGYQEKFTALAEQRKLSEELDQLFTPLGIPGAHRGEAIRRLVAAENALRQDPIGAVTQLIGGAGIAGTQQAEHFVRQLAASLGVNLGGAGQAQAKTPAEARLAALEQQIQQRERLEHQRQQQFVQQQAHQAQAKILEFAQAKDGSGQALRPHFDRVKATMGSLIQAAAATGKTLSLEDAYAQAAWADPELRAELQKAETARKAAEAEAARKAAVAKAKAAKTPKSASRRVPDLAPVDGIEAELARGFDELFAA